MTIRKGSIETCRHTCRPQILFPRLPSTFAGRSTRKSGLTMLHFGTLTRAETVSIPRPRQLKQLGGLDARRPFLPAESLFRHRSFDT